MNIKKYLLLILVFLFLFLFPEKEHIQDYQLKEQQETYLIIFTGDIMLNRGVKYMVDKYGQDYSFPFLKIKNNLQKADILFGNLESVISDKGNKIGSIYSFRAPPQAMQGLLYAGFDVVSLANNHAFDYNREAFEDTLIRLKNNNISYTGAGFNKKEAHSPAIIELNNNFKVGFLGYTEFLYPHAFAQENLSGITTLSQENLKNDIQKAKTQVDFLVVTFHYGDEYQKQPNQKQKELSRQAIDYGADIIIGHHPHVTQPVEKYNDKYIAYSLGNFVFDQYFSSETMKGFMLSVEIKNSQIINIEKIHYKINEYYQPEVVEITPI